MMVPHLSQSRTLPSSSNLITRRLVKPSLIHHREFIEKTKKQKNKKKQKKQQIAEVCTTSFQGEKKNQLPPS